MNYKLPWHLPADLKNFKKMTMGKSIIMGRKTHESIGRPLPGRENIVLTADANYGAEGCIVMNSLDAVFDYLQDRQEIIFMGGADIYAQVLGRTDRIYLTEVHAEVAGDTCFPPLDSSAWKETARQDFRADEKNEYNYSFVILERR
jgi:Dihydrofolate reductase